MKLTVSWVHALLTMGLALSMLLGFGGPAWALGAGSPPRVLSAVVFISTSSTLNFPGLTDGIPQLIVQFDFLIPGGFVPQNVQSVTVQVPGIAPAFTLTNSVNDLFVETTYTINLTQAGVVGFPTGTYTFTVTDTAGG
jgi:hypothetical protein